MMRFLIGKIEWEDDVTFRFRGIVKRALLRCIIPLFWKILFRYY